MRKLMTVEKMAERKKQRELLEKIFGTPRPTRTWRRPKQIKPTNTRKDMNISDAVFQSCIAEYSTGRFKIKKGEIVAAFTFSTTTPRRQPRRKVETRRVTLTLTHRPTGVSQPCWIEPGNYSKAELRKLREKTIKDYMPFLDRKVKGYLKACMARQFGPIPKGEYDEK